MMGGRAKDTYTLNPYIYELNDLWVISDSLGTWKEILKDCKEMSCSKHRPAFVGSTAKAIGQPQSPCQCKESVLVFNSGQNNSTVWELRCIKDEERYVWLEFQTNVTMNHGFEFQGKLTTSSVKQSLVFMVTTNRVWQYSHNTTHWSSIMMKVNETNITESSDFQYPSTQDLDLVDHSLFLNHYQQFVLFGRVLTHVFVFTPATRKWKSEVVVGKPPPVTKYAASVINSTILIYAGNYGGCKQLVWTLKRSHDASVWYWTQIPIPAIEPQQVTLRASALLVTIFISEALLQGLTPTTNHSYGTWI